MWNSVQTPPVTSGSPKAPPSRRSIADLLAPLEEIAAQSSSLVSNPGARFEVAGETCEIPRFLFIGPQGGAAPLRVGIFAAINGDEPEGAYALVQFAGLLEANPELATGYSLFLYPVCNPTGFEDNTRQSRHGRDLNREFWSNSPTPEVRLLQSELASHTLHGIISLHTDRDATGFYGVVSGATLTRHLLEPALKHAEGLLPIDQRSLIGGFHARDGIVQGGQRGRLGVPPRVRPQPFEIALEVPKASPTFVKETAFVLTLQTILSEYRKLIAYAQNI